MNPYSDLEKQRAHTQELLNALQNESSYEGKLRILDSISIVKEFLRQPSGVKTFITQLTPECEFVIKSVIALDQGPIVFNAPSMNESVFTRMLQLLEQLLEIEAFYLHLGGVIGYHLRVIELILCQQKEGSAVEKNARYIHPEGLYIGHDTEEVRKAIRSGIENIPFIGMIYPLGGAGDRLNLKEATTGAPLPAALLPFLGFSLLEGLIRELQAREYLYFKLFQVQVTTPIAIMTSVEKNNHVHILNICKKHNWFGRPSETFFLFLQPVVPVITIDGNWSLSAPLVLNLKPCGHGVLWKLADEQGVLDWLESLGKHYCLIRQINNPVAGTDHSLFSLAGIGSGEKKDFGFLSCERLLNSDEGTDVLIETEKETGFEYCLTNIEYTDFTKRGIGEHPATPGSLYSIYPTNTNVLFANISAIRNCIKICPIPGQLVNMKHKVSYIDAKGNQQLVLGARLESTMQNIADYLIDRFPKKLEKEEYGSALRTFIIYNKRSKTISTTKKLYVPNENAHGTPEQTYYDLLSNHHALLNECGFELPAWNDFSDYIVRGPSCIILHHPGLGPLYSVIAQKIRTGRLHAGSEIQLEIAEVDIEDLNLEGSLLIKALSPLGTANENKILQYGGESRCSLKKIEIKNQGIDRNVTQCYWKNELVRKECVTILLHEGSEFHAEGLTLEGTHEFEVPPHHRLTLRPLSNGKWEKELIPINKPTWSWHYSFDADNRVKLTKEYPI